MDADKHNADVIRLLASIDASLKALVARRPAPAATNGRAAAPTGEIEPATASDLDGKYGNPSVRKDPKGWEGESYVNQSYSDCPSDYLTALAKDLMSLAAYIEKQDGNDAKARFKRLDARRAAGWAIRNKGATRAARAHERDDSGDASTDFSDSDIPF